MTEPRPSVPSRRLPAILLASLVLVVAGSLGSLLPSLGPAITVPPTATAVESGAPAPPSPTAVPTTAVSPSQPSATAAVVAASPGPAPSPTVSIPPFSGAEALRQVKALSADIGPRPSSSAAADQAARYLQGQFTSLGYGTRLQPYSFNLFQERSTQLRLKQPEAVEISAMAFVFSGSGTIEARLVSAGFGSPSDFPTSGLEGQIALIERGGGLSFQQKIDAALARRAAGVIVFNDRAGELLGSLERQAAVPVVGILQHDGKRLQELLRQGPVALTLKVDASTQPRQGSNVVASPKLTPGRKRVVIGGHYDSVAVGPGANDNASGVGTLLALAGAVKERRYPFDLAFVAFGDEEVGLWGSRKYLELVPSEERAQIAAMVNLDMVGVGEAMEFYGDRDLVGRALRIALEMSYPATQSTPGPRDFSGSDHASFVDAGIPAVFFHRREDPYYHTPQDTADRIPASNLEAAGKVALRLLAELDLRN